MKKPFATETHSLESAALGSPLGASVGQLCGPQRSSHQRDLFTLLGLDTTDSGSTPTSDSAETFPKSTCLQADFLAKISPSPVSVPDSPASDQGFSITLLEYFMAYGLSISSLRTCLGFSQAIKAETCKQSCTDAPVSARPFLSADGVRPAESSDPHTRLYGAFSIRSFSESPRDAVECSLSDILLETSVVPLRFYLSARACAGILRRAAKRGVTLPTHLLTALTKGATQQPTSTSLRRSRNVSTATALRMIRPSWLEHFKAEGSAAIASERKTHVAVNSSRTSLYQIKAICDAFGMSLSEFFRDVERRMKW